MVYRAPTQVRPHERLAELLRERIRNGVWHRGQMLPGRRAIAAEQNVAVTTVERAVATLISEGLLRADYRRGTFVAETGGTSATADNATGHMQHDMPAATVALVASVLAPAAGVANDTQWPAQVLQACEHALSADLGLTQCFINLHNVSGPALKPEQVLKQLQAARADGVIALEHASDALIRHLAALGSVPVVLARYDACDTALPLVYIDSTPGGMQAARHLRERGYRNLTFLRPFTGPWVEARLAGARAELGAANLRVFPTETALTVPQVGRAQSEAGRAALHELFANGFARGTGIIAPNDAVARGFMRAAAEQGLTAGTDYGIVGFDDWDRDSQLTSLRPPLEQLGAEAARLMQARLRGDSCPFRVALQHGLIARGSTRGWTPCMRP